MNSIAYKYNRFDPGVFMEVYLPKKAEYQGILYDTLTGGFHVENVRRHLKENWQRICNLMGGYYTNRVASLDQLERVVPVFYGYSMYEVDGVFFNDKTKSPVEERTQVIRLMFRFDIEGFVQSEHAEFGKEHYRIAKLVTDDYLNYCTNKPAFLEVHWESYEKQWPQHESLIRSLISRLADWEFSIAMFIMGYVVFEICEKIKSLHQISERDPEEEIWITSFWNLRVNRVIKDGNEEADRN